MSLLPSLPLLLVLLPFSSPHFTPTDDHLLNCGGSSPTTPTDADTRIFVPDAPLLHSSPLRDPQSLPTSLYSTARVFTRPSAYTLRINVAGPHLLRLHFGPFRHLHSARFHVLADRSVLLHNLSFDCMDHLSPSPLVKEFILHLQPGDLRLAFLPATRPGIAFVSAIELLSAPHDLVPETARLVQKGVLRNFNGVSHGNFETLFRVNVGGAKVTPSNDTLWRTWVPDQPSPSSNAAVGLVKAVHFSGRIQYREYGASREIAPDHVYNTARVMMTTATSTGDRKMNMSWAFPVPFGHEYLIRLHFCDIASLALNELYFNVFINGDLAYENLDVSDATGGMLAAPYYVDIVAGPDELGRVVVTIAPSNMSGEFRIQGMLNGLEIMKVNDSMGNLDGDVSAEVLLGSQKEGGAGGLVLFVFCAMMFSVVLASGFMLALMWRSASKGHSGWSLLPIEASEGRSSYEIPMTAGKSIYF